MGCGKGTTFNSCKSTVFVCLGSAWPFVKPNATLMRRTAVAGGSWRKQALNDAELEAMVETSNHD